VEFATEGVFLCGMAHYPKHIPEVINQAYGAAGKALTILTHEKVTVSGSVCEINEKKCIGCGACIDVCNYRAIDFVKVKGAQKALVNPVICKGDGLCNVKCPTGAIELKHFTDEELLSQIEAAGDNLI
jgi:heterodisulfide reductase subunit A